MQCKISPTSQGGAGGVMLFILIFLTPQSVVADVTNGKTYEKIPTIGLHCKGVELEEGVRQGGCAIMAVAESIYNFGFEVQEQTCLVCRADGMLGEADALEITITGPLNVEGGDYKHTLTTLSSYSFKIYIS